MFAKCKIDKRFGNSNAIVDFGGRRRRRRRQQEFRCFCISPIKFTFEIQQQQKKIMKIFEPDIQSSSSNINLVAHFKLKLMNLDVYIQVLVHYIYNLFFFVVGSLICNKSIVSNKLRSVNVSLRFRNLKDEFCLIQLQK